MKKIFLSLIAVFCGVAVRGISFADVPANLPANCIAYNDGCNSCDKSGNGRVCTEMACLPMSGQSLPAPRCTAYADTGATDSGLQDTGVINPGGPIMCSMLYMPVCGSQQVECFAAPCPAVEQTYANSCVAGTAGATVIHPGACMPVTGSSLANTSWSLTVFDAHAVALAAPITLAFSVTGITANICSTMGGDYSATNSILSVNWTTPQTAMCTMDRQQYRSAFDLSGASYITDDSTLTLTTSEGDTYVRQQNVSPAPVVLPAEGRKYAFIIRQVNQVMKAQHIFDLAGQQVFLQSLIDKVNSRIAAGPSTGIGHYLLTYLDQALQYYYANLSDPTRNTF